MKFTPRKINALLQLQERRMMGERADMMRAVRTAINGDDKVFRKMTKKMDDESQ